MIVDINHFNLLPDERVCDILQFANNRWQGDVCTRFRHLTNFIHVPEMLKTLTSFKADIPLPRRKKRESDRAYIMRSVKVMAALQNIYNNKESYGFKKPTPLPVVFKAVAKKERYIENAQVAFFCKKAFPIIYDPFLELRNSMAFIGESYRVQMAEMHGTAQEVDMSGGDPLKRLSGEIGCFTQIKTLNLSKNSLTFLPPALARLKNLRIIYLSRNQFTEFPKVLLKLKKLEDRIEFSSIRLINCFKINQ